MPKQNRDRNVGDEQRSTREEQQPQADRNQQEQVNGGSTSSDQSQKMPSSQRQPGRLPLPD
jgi:hypothetical protein